VKDCSRIEADFGSTEAPSLEASEGTKFRLNKVLVLIGASALMFCLLLGSRQFVKADGISFTVADINATPRGLPQAVSYEKPSQPHEQYAADQALSALSSYAQQIEAEAPKVASAENSDNPHHQFKDEAFLALAAYARGIGAAQPEPMEAPLKLAEADNAFDALKEFLQKQNGAAPPEQPKAPPPKPAKRETPVVAATYVGTNVCLGCHSSEAGPFGYTEMGRLVKQGKLTCETCHGPGSEHVRLGGGVGVGGIISFRTSDDSRTAEENNGICLACHERGERTMWAGSPHEERGLACTNCHTIMKAVSARFQLATAFQPDTCFQCHKDIRAKTLMSAHMPIGEGKVVCSDCHNPHGSFTEAMLRTDTINDTCYKCHAEKRGPFLFEHEPVRENCLNCHDPHGSVNEYMLKESRPRLCFECHGFGHGMVQGPGGFSFGASMGQSCQNCHINIHGSNSPAGAVFQR
jgi:DmsE family decaheme c-type cytochrome